MAAGGRRPGAGRPRGVTAGTKHARLEKMLGAGKITKSNINNRGYNKYLKMEGEVNISIDDKKFNPIYALGFVMRR